MHLTQSRDICEFTLYQIRGLKKKMNEWILKALTVQQQLPTDTSWPAQLKNQFKLKEQYGVGKKTTEPSTALLLPT